jgi:antitoxin MazE
VLRASQHIPEVLIISNPLRAEQKPKPCGSEGGFWQNEANLLDGMHCECSKHDGFGPMLERSRAYWRIYLCGCGCEAVFGRVRGMAAIDEGASRTYLHCKTRYPLHGPSMKVAFQRWGNSLALRVPKVVAQEIGASDGKTAEMSVRDGKLVIEVTKPRRRRRRYTLDELVAGITPENRHEAIDWGPPVGNEVW